MIQVTPKTATRNSLRGISLATPAILLLLAGSLPILAATSGAPTAPPGAKGATVSRAVEQKVQAEIAADTPRLQEIFKDIHQHPELGFMETRTADIVARELRELGFEVKTGIGKTGVVGILKNGAGPVVMYRADMDANAVEEATGLPYASKVRVQRSDGVDVPVAHLCGHDAHVTWLLGVAKALVAVKADWKGTLVLVAQPAEEPIMGAKAMVADGMYEKGVPKPDYLIGLHTTPGPTGVVVTRAGELNAGTDQLDVTFHGVGGHGSSPHLTKDPVLMAAIAVVDYQFIVSRAIDPLHAAVITVGSIQAGSDNNVIPASSLVKINLRWYDAKDRQLMLDGIERINQSIAMAYGLPAELKPTTVMKGGSVVLDNDPGMVATVVPVLRSLLGEKAVITDMPKVMGSEDFQHLVIDNEKHRYLYMYVGTAKPADFAAAQAQGKLVPYSNHNPDYRVDLDAIPVGAVIGTVSVLTFMGAGVTP